MNVSLYSYISSILHILLNLFKNLSEKLSYLVFKKLPDKNKTVTENWVKKVLSVGTKENK